MPNVVMLSAADAAAVTWISADRMAALIPLRLTDGRYIVGPEVVADPVHLRSRARLQGLNQVDYTTLSAVIPTRSIARSLNERS
jgi:hypothetical protein